MWMATGNILLFLIRLVFIRLSLMICALFCMYTELPKKKKKGRSFEEEMSNQIFRQERSGQWFNYFQIDITHTKESLRDSDYQPIITKIKNGFELLSTQVKPAQIA